MALDKDGLNVIRELGAIGTGKGSVKHQWGYVTNDTRAQVETDGYFDALADRMATGDVITVSYDCDGTPGVRIYVVVVTTGDIALTPLYETP
ncbi:hypothetical protein [Maricaulis sp.]|uniref:hypothetical protein n=1 Tax=Maricaulis sp. TaxID=1486257 RepID=UPI00329A56BC